MQNNDAQVNYRFMPHPEPISRTSCHFHPCSHVWNNTMPWYAHYGLRSMQTAILVCSLCILLQIVQLRSQLYELLVYMPWYIHWSSWPDYGALSLLSANPVQWRTEISPSGMVRSWLCTQLTDMIFIKKCLGNDQMIHSVIPVLVLFPFNSNACPKHAPPCTTSPPPSIHWILLPRP